MAGDICLTSTNARFDETEESDRSAARLLMRTVCATKFTSPWRQAREADGAEIRAEHRARLLRHHPGREARAGGLDAFDFQRVGFVVHDPDAAFQVFSAKHADIDGGLHPPLQVEADFRNEGESVLKAELAGMSRPGMAARFSGEIAPGTEPLQSWAVSKPLPSQTAKS